MWIGGWIRSFLAKRVRFQGPEAKALKQQGETIEKTVVAVNCLIELKGPELDMLIALGEAMQGKNNGNVTDAFIGTREAKATFTKYQQKAACIEVRND